MNRFKIIIGIILLIFGSVAAYENYILQGNLQTWEGFGNTGLLNYVGHELWVLVPIIYIFCLSFGLIGLYIIYEGMQGRVKVQYWECPRCHRKYKMGMKRCPNCGIYRKEEEQKT